MTRIKTYQKIRPKDPILIAAWPGMGDVAIGAAKYLKDKLQAKLFARLKSERFFYETDVTVRENLIQLSGVPDGQFYYWPNPNEGNDLMIFINDLQPPPEKSLSYAQALIRFALSFKVKMSITFAAMLTTMDYKQTPKVWAAATHRKIITDFKRINVRPMGSGQISGLNGLFLGVARKEGMPGICLLGEIPFYAAHVENPNASLAILNTLTRFLRVPLDLSELSLAAKAAREEMAGLMEYVRESDMAVSEEPPKPINEEDIDRMKTILAAHSHTPSSIRRQIEELFLKVKDRVCTAMDLKKKLDEWNVYKEYEDRFLELFRDDQIKNQ